MLQMQIRRGGGKRAMGYPVEMIGKDTALYSLIGVNAIEDANAEVFNKYLIEKDFDAKMMPLNIRQDDIGFFINGFKDSKIKEAYFSSEYWQILYELLEYINDEVKVCGMCDTIKVIDKQNIGEVYYGKACASLIEENMTVVVYGNSPTAKSVLYNIVKKSPKLVILADMIVENCLEMSTIIPDATPSDIQRTEVDKLDADVIYDGINQTIKIGDNVLNYQDILEKIAQIKTKEWTENG
jgi:shikimate 5-dehydrogenase